MLLLTCLVVFAAAASLLLLPYALRHWEILRRYAGSRAVTCPENQQTAAVNIDLRHAAATAIDGPPHVRLCDCTRWPERAHCNQGCLAQAARQHAGEPAQPAAGVKPIHHLPIALAAFAAWCLGALWHAQYVYRAAWSDAFGLTRDELRQMVWWLSPHLLTAAVCLLFAYGVAWLLAISHRRGVLNGVLMSVLLCGAVLATASWGLARLPQQFLVTEAEYIALAALTVGAIVGGLSIRPAPAKTR